MIESMGRDLRAKLSGIKGSGNGKRKVLLGIAGFLLILVLLQTGWSKYHELKQELSEQIDLKRVRYENLVRTIEKSQAYRKENANLKQYKQELLQSRFIQGDTAALAEAKLQNLMNEIANQTKVNILSMRMLPRKNEEDLTFLSIGLNCRARIGAIQDFLNAVYQNEKFMYFKELEVKIVNRREEKYFNMNVQITALSQL